MPICISDDISVPISGIGEIFAHNGDLFAATAHPACAAIEEDSVNAVASHRESRSHAKIGFVVKGFFDWFRIWVCQSECGKIDDCQKVADAIVADGGKATAIACHIGEMEQIQSVFAFIREQFGRLDILVNNAAHQATFEKPEDISATEWDVTFRTNIHGMFYLSKRAVARMEPGGTIINTASINSTDPSPGLLAYATTKGAIQNFTAGLCRMVADRGIRVNAVAPGPVWTPLIPSTMPEEKVKSFGGNTPLGRAGQPAELAGAYVFLASEDATYITGAVIEVTGGRPML